MGSYVRKLKKDIYFVERMQEDLHIYEHFVNDVIISDVRMPKELDELKDFETIKIKVENSLLNYDLTAEESKHETEHALDTYQGFDYVIKDKNEVEMKEILAQIVKERE